MISWLESADRADIEHATRLRIVLVFVAELAISSHLAQLQSSRVGFVLLLRLPDVPAELDNPSRLRLG